MVSYEEGEVVQVFHPPSIDTPRVAKVKSVDDEFGVELMFTDSTIAWICWGPFAYVKEFPKFSMGLISPERFVLDDLKKNSLVQSGNRAENSKEEGRANEAIKEMETEMEYVTIGKGWLNVPFVLPKKMSVPANKV
jgi:hypothetical protein